MLSNHIAETQLPEGVVVSYCRAQRGVAEITISHRRKRAWAIKSQRWSKELGIISKQTSFQKTPKTILKYY